MANECFHILYHQGIWLDRQLASMVLEKGYAIPDTQLNLAKFTVSRVFYADKFDEVLLPLMKKTELYIWAYGQLRKATLLQLAFAATWGGTSSKSDPNFIF